MSSQDANDRCLPHGLGSDLGGTLESRSVEGPSSLMAHQPPGDVGCISCSQEFPDRSQGPPCACPLRQHIGGLLHKSPGRFEVTSTLQTGVPNPPVVQRKLLSLRATYIPGAHNIGADILSRQGLRPGDWRLHPEVVELIWKESARHKWICLHLERRLTAHSGSPSRIQLLSDWMRWHRCGRGFILRISPDRSAPGSTGESSPGPVPLLLIAPRWPGRVWFPNLFSLLDGPPLELPVRRDLLSQAGGSIFHPHPELWKLWAWPLRGPSSNSGLSTEVVETILHSRAPSTRKLYALKWKVFASWCSDHQLETINSTNVRSPSGNRGYSRNRTFLCVRATESTREIEIFSLLLCVSKPLFRPQDPRVLYQWWMTMFVYNHVIVSVSVHF